jgi:hypothetical protein
MSLHQHQTLSDFFSADRWRPSIDRFPLSGLSLVERVNAMRPRLVIDVGCGFNPFKGKIANLIGFDLINRHADIVCSIGEAPFSAACADVVLALGSINFGPRTQVAAQLRRVAGWMRPGSCLFMRCNPGEAVGDEIDVFPWSAALARELGEEVGLRVDGDIHEERLVLSNGVDARRLFWIYRLAFTHQF